MLSATVTSAALLAASLCWLSEGYVDVVCPGENPILQCPDGQIIELRSLGHGRRSGMDCSDRTKPRPLTDDQCLHSQMTPWSKFICGGLNYCRLPKLNKRMFVCDDTMDDFLQVTYDCVDRSPGERSNLTCQGEDANIKCEEGVIVIKRAAYGRLDETTCSDTPSIMTFCRSYSSHHVVSNMCDGLRECKVPVTDETLGSAPYCDHSTRYLTVDYACQ